MTNPTDLKTALISHFTDRARQHPTILTEPLARSVERQIELSIDHYVLVCRLKMLWGWHIEVAPRKPYSQPVGVKNLYHLYTGGKKVINTHGYPLVFGSLLEALTYDPVWATVVEALALVPEGWGWRLTNVPLRDEIIKAYFIPLPHEETSLDTIVCEAPTPAAAILAARLDWEARKEKK